MEQPHLPGSAHLPSTPSALVQCGFSEGVSGITLTHRSVFSPCPLLRDESTLKIILDIVQNPEAKLLDPVLKASEACFKIMAKSWGDVSLAKAPDI